MVLAAAAVVYGKDLGADYFLEKIKSFEQLLLPQSSKVVQPEQVEQYVSDISYEQAVIEVVKNATPSVVSIVISKNVPVYEQEFINPFGADSPFDFQIPQYVQKGSQLQEVGAGSGFIISSDGLILTNKHVVSDKSAEYTVYTSDEQKYKAKVMALDPAQDLAIIKIDAAGKIFTPMTLGDSSGTQLGQGAIAIGNALGQFSNTVSVGIISGLGRTISASNQIGSVSETLENTIQTDAAINAGNSGGPLLNLKGEVIGINTAMAEGAQDIGFAIPINVAKRDIQQFAVAGKIVYPFLGVRYVLLESGGAEITKGPAGETAVTAGSAAEKAGLKEGDIILEINSEKITTSDTMAAIIQKYNPGDTITLKILRDGSEISLDTTLGER